MSDPEVLTPAVQEEAAVTATGATAIVQRAADPVLFIEKMASWIYESKMLGCTSLAQAKVLALASVTENKSLLEIDAQYHIIDDGRGRVNLSMKADAMRAKFMRRGGKIVWHERSAKVAKATFSVRGQEPITVEITLKELMDNGVAIAKKGGLKSNYRQFPRAMLTARCSSEGIRTLDPESNKGRYTPEEVSDFSPMLEAPATQAIEGATAPEDQEQDQDQQEATETENGDDTIPHTGGPTPACPACKGQMWDNRKDREADQAAGRGKRARPSFKCRNKDCDGVIWSYGTWVKANCEWNEAEQKWTLMPF